MNNNQAAIAEFISANHAEIEAHLGLYAKGDRYNSLYSHVVSDMLLDASDKIHEEFAQALQDGKGMNYYRRYIANNVKYSNSSLNYKTKKMKYKDDVDFNQVAEGENDLSKINLCAADLYSALDNIDDDVLFRNKHMKYYKQLILDKVKGLTLAEIACTEKVSQSTVSRDIKEFVEKILKPVLIEIVT